VRASQQRGVYSYIPTEPGRSADADKIEAVMATWESMAQEAPVSV
jgi:hypothetical protein